MQARKKIVRIFSRLNVGGPTLHVVNLTRGLERLSYDTVLVVGTVSPDEGDMGYYARDRGVSPELVPEFGARLSPWRDLIALVRIAGILRRERPDIVHTHTFKAGLLGRIAAKLCGVPMIVHTFHGHLLAGYWGRAKTTAVATVERLLGLITDRVITVSDRVTQDLVRHGIVPPQKITTVPLGFDMPLVRSQLALAPTLRQRLKIPADHRVVGVVGRLVPIKGVDFFLASLTPLLASDPKLHLVIVGDGPDRVALQNLARELNAPDPATLGRIHFAGWFKPMISEYGALDLCVCTSSNEGTSVAIIEAVMAGVPVVSVDVGGMKDLLGAGLWGDVVAREPHLFREAVARNLAAGSRPGSEAYINQLKRTEAARRSFGRIFDAERLSDDIDRVYRGVPLA